jgi:PKD repeat protein
MIWAKIKIWGIFLILSFSAYGACDAYFNYSFVGSSFEVSFDNQSSSETEILQYYWDLGDGTIKSSESFIYTYQHPGIFNVSLTIITENACISNYTRKIYVGIESSSDTCNIPINVSIGNATYPEYNDAWINVNTENPLISYQWSTGCSGNEITSLEPGFYTLTLTDNNGCKRTEVFEIGYNNNCHAFFYVDSLTYSQTPGVYRFHNNSTGEIASYFWDFGDGTFSNTRNPLHVFTEPGVYNVCLYIDTYYSCTHYYCYSIEVQDYIPPVDIHGIVYAGSSKLPLGMAVLYEKDNNIFKAIDKCLIQNGEYYFEDLSVSNAYLIYAVPEFNIDQVYFPKYFPAYNGSECKWQNANTIILSSKSNYDIFLPEYSDIFIGDSKINGSVFLSENSLYSKPIFQTVWFDSINQFSLGKASNIVVYLINDNNEIIDFCLTNNHGNYEFNNLPYGEYIVRAEKAGMLSQEINIVLDENNTDIVAKDLIIKSSLIQTDKQEFYYADSFSLYPNPTDSHVFIDLNDNNRKSVKIFSADGEKIKEFITESPHICIDLNATSAGVYLIVVRGNNYIFQKKVIKVI